MLRPAARGHDIEEEVKVGAKKDCWEAMNVGMESAAPFEIVHVISL
jgi:hypothetical protein